MQDTEAAGPLAAHCHPKAGHRAARVRAAADEGVAMVKIERFSSSAPARWAAAVLVLAVAGCGGTGVQVGSLLGYEGLGQQVRSFYARRAWEENAVCNTPEMQAIRSATIVDETDDRIVALIRYTWVDEGANDPSSTRIRRGGGSSCRGIDERRFTLQKHVDGVRVITMSGPQQPVR